MEGAGIGGRGLEFNPAGEDQGLHIAHSVVPIGSATAVVEHQEIGAIPQHGVLIDGAGVIGAICAAAAINGVIASAADDRVIPATTIDAVVSTLAIEAVITDAAEDGLVVVAAKDRVIAITAIQHRSMGI